MKAPKIKLKNGVYRGDLSPSRGISSLPNRLTKITGNLDLRGTAITQLPENLEVGGYLDLEGCSAIIQLPKNLEVGDLYLRGPATIRLPENLEVSLSIYQ